MKHCDRCDVDIADNIKNCPLCGRDISAESDDELESFVCYPDNKIWFSKRNTVLNTSFLIILIGVIVSIVTELMALTPHARPSSPSMRLTALVTPTIQMMVTGMLR